MKLKSTICRRVAIAWISLLIKFALHHCGLATTHLAKPIGSTLRGSKSETGYIVNGTIPWFTGYSIFEVAVIGFVTNSEIVFAVIDMQNSLVKEALQVSPLELAALLGSSSVSIDVRNISVLPVNIVSIRDKNVPPAPRFTPYIGAEVGIAANALERTKALLHSSKHPKVAAVRDCYDQLEEKLQELRNTSIELKPKPSYLFEVHELLRDAVRLLTLMSGASAIQKNSQVARWNSELSVFDVVIQSPATLQMKLDTLKRHP